MAKETENIAEQSKVAETVAGKNGEAKLANPKKAKDTRKDKLADKEQGLVDSSKAKATVKDKSKTDRSARKSRRAKILEEAQAEEDEGATATQERNVQAGDNTKQVPAKKSKRKDRDANNKVGENLVEDGDLRDPVELASGGSGSKSSQRSTLRNIVRGGRVPNEDILGLPEMWQMMKDMMSPMAEIVSKVALEAQPKEPVQEAAVLSVQEVARPKVLSR